ncbi:hypothetical protein ACF0H5_020238 [Mactra antiquata]
MNDEIRVLSAVELCLPMNMMKEALFVTERSVDAVFHSSCMVSTQELEVKLRASKSDTHLKVYFDKLCFVLKDGVHECTLVETSASTDTVDKNSKEDINIANSTVESNIISYEPQSSSSQLCSVSDNLSESTAQVKRKRGRPKKSDCQKIIGEETSNIGGNMKELSLTSNGSHEAPYSDLVETKGYCLRGNKLNKDVMAVEKEDFENDDNDSYNVDNDEDYSPDHEADDGYNCHRKSKIMKNNVKDISSKENVDDAQPQKLINNEIMTILSESDCSLVKTLVKKTELSCKYCKVLFYNTSKLSVHVDKLHSDCEDSVQFLKEIMNVKKIDCDLCDEKFNTLASYQSHLIDRHEMEKDLKCPRCDHTSQTWQNFKYHVRNMHLEQGVKRAFCHLCTASFRSHASLKQHIDLNHFGNKHAKCDICGKTFYNRSQLKRHSRIHGANVSKRFICEVCNKSFMFDYNLKRHLSSVHQALVESFHCSYCGKGFSQKTPMISHVQLVHFNLYPYTCTVCKNSFPRASMVREHMRCVHDEPNYQVPVLPKNSLYDKTDEDKFYCSYCSSGFVHKIRLIEHMHKDHADAFPYKCDICVQGFLERSFLNHHSLKVHGTLVADDDVGRSKDAGQIMQVITTTTGCPSKVMQTVEIQNDEGLLEDAVTDVSSSNQNETTITSSNHNEATISPDIIQTSQHNDTTSVVVQVDNDGSTYHYVIEAPSNIDEMGSEAMVQDIASLLLAAKQNTPKEWNEQYNNTTEPVEVSLTIHENKEVIETDLSHVTDQQQQQQQIVQVQYGDSMDNVNFVRFDGTQELPMEVVIDDNDEINSITLAVENQEVLNVASGDIIELNDKSEGKNFYRIVNVVDEGDSSEQSNLS